MISEELISSLLLDCSVSVQVRLAWCLFSLPSQPFSLLVYPLSFLWFCSDADHLGLGVEILICECTELNVELLGVLG